MSKQRTQTPILIFSILAVVAIVAVIFLLNRLSSDTSKKTTSRKPIDTQIFEDKEGNIDETVTGFTQNAEDLVGHIKEIVIQSNESGDAQPLIDLIGLPNLTANQVRNLHRFAKNRQLKLDPTQPFSGKDNDWTLHLANKESIQLNLIKKPDGTWEVNRVILPSHLPSTNTKKTPTTATKKVTQKSIDVAKAQETVQTFLSTILKLDPSATHPYIDSKKITYSTLAGLCILFEEGRYELAKDKAIRNMFLTNNTAGWLIRLNSTNPKKSAMLGITTKRADSNSPWKITEINMDKLLSSYASQFSDGDIHYVPLVKNPHGGDSIVLYFELDSNKLTQRTKKQLNIIANLLKKSPAKKLNISGYTDALGSDGYNINLSRKRAEQVISYLSTQGVHAKQMQLTSFGKSNPRQPNDTEEGRRANRRAEILLDF